MKTIRLLAWLAVFLSAVLTGCERNRKAEAPPEVTHFWFDYNYNPNPGKRVWMRVDKTTWVEFYPNGVQSRYKVTDRTAVNGQAGTVVSKLAGDPTHTQTLNDGSFEAFIPDKGEGKMPLYFRQRSDGKWSDWTLLTEIKLIE